MKVRRLFCWLFTSIFTIIDSPESFFSFSFSVSFTCLPLIYSYSTRYIPSDIIYHNFSLNRPQIKTSFLVLLSSSKPFSSDNSFLFPLPHPLSTHHNPSDIINHNISFKCPQIQISFPQTTLFFFLSSSHSHLNRTFNFPL